MILHSFLKNKCKQLTFFIKEDAKNAKIFVKKIVNYRYNFFIIDDSEW